MEQALSVKMSKMPMIMISSGSLLLATKLKITGKAHSGILMQMIGVISRNRPREKMSGLLSMLLLAQLIKSL